jgi:Lrp/AsnC family transcriptional regulator for asnA, asnC and gidA
MVRYSNLDKIDSKILEILKKNAREPYTKIGKIVGLSEAGVRKRIRKLEKLNIIKKYTIEVNYEALNMKIAWIGIDVKPEQLMYVIDKLKNLDNVENIYISYGDHDIMIEFIYKDQRELNDLIKLIEKMKGVVRICPAVLVEKVF